MFDLAKNNFMNTACLYLFLRYILEFVAIPCVYVHRATINRLMQY